ncbi:MAG: RluA family pseudouridine synthase [Streptococcaceae bacterium]|jgi:23S rRNA pseudouridine1911/1915/1917 synthase|nr:RluA family pseudouridine synthase [Streptococcaceae bacterium]
MKYTFEIKPMFSGLTITELFKCWHIPKKIVHLLRENRGINLNDNLTSLNQLLNTGDKLTIQLQREWFSAKKPKLGSKNLANIIWEDEHLVIVNKPLGVKVHGNSPDEIGLVNYVAAASGGEAYVVHRLDAATSGLVLFAKTLWALPVLSNMFEVNEIHRTYEAVVPGTFSKKDFVIAAPIGRDRHHPTRRRVSATGQSAKTHVHILAKGKGLSLVECTLETGRTHQIRVHLAYLKHPIVGDALYGGKTNGCLLLHAKRMQFQHPFTGDNIDVSCKAEHFPDF